MDRLINSYRTNLLGICVVFAVFLLGCTEVEFAALDKTESLKADDATQEGEELGNSSYFTEDSSDEIDTSSYLTEDSSDENDTSSYLTEYESSDDISPELAECYQQGEYEVTDSYVSYTRSGTNVSEIVQTDKSNRAEVHQVGQSNYSCIYQQGSNNTAHVSQSGASNVSITRQVSTGSGDSAVDRSSAWQCACYLAQTL